jgi:predicted MFS family arabinose efflux permease
VDETVGRDRTEPLVTGYSGRLLIAISIGWGFIQAGRLIVSPLLPAISADLGLSSTYAGFAITVL